MENYVFFKKEKKSLKLTYFDQTLFALHETDYFLSLKR